MMIMPLFDLSVIAIGLSMDAFAVATTHGALMVKWHGKIKWPIAFRIALFFGVFQALMPALGWLAGRSVRDTIQNFDHWLAFIILCFIGGKMIWESKKIEEAENKEEYSDSLWLLFGLALATSIDALAVGLSFSFLNVQIPFPAVFIGVTTFLLSALGVYLGSKLKHFFEKRIEFVGGVVLMGIGIKILIEHLVK